MKRVGSGDLTALAISVQQDSACQGSRPARELFFFSPVRLTRWIFSQSRPFGPSGFPSANRRRARVTSLPRWLKYGGHG
ncbi:hypothetical protein EYF80_025602 [Liparis tanakae]|uniref:Uncharacterized protein n=1 Tax=Liparis tanakae TaxID=230148 RepID=A0A4Z2HGR4_9TELE|nr:hypothetical protein EYF80_025602 [Liparis tanakae]